jgi:hypothetical protein
MVGWPRRGRKRRMPVATARWQRRNARYQTANDIAIAPRVPA